MALDEPPRSCAVGREQFTRYLIPDATSDTSCLMPRLESESNFCLLESLILAQDERWRRA